MSRFTRFFLGKFSKFQKCAGVNGQCPNRSDDILNGAPLIRPSFQALLSFLENPKSGFEIVLRRELWEKKVMVGARLAE